MKHYKGYFVCIIIVALMLIGGCDSEKPDNNLSDVEHTTDFMTTDKLEQLLENADSNASWYGYRFIACMKAVSVCDHKQDMVKVVHDWLCKNVSLYSDGTGEVPQWADNAEGPFVHGKATAKGYNNAFSKCMEIVGVECEVVEGQVNGSTTQWVAVCLDDEWYHINLVLDDTYDDLGDRINYNYFNVTDAELSANHTWTKTRECNGTRYGYYNYYYAEQKIENATQFLDYMAQNCNNKEIVVVVNDAAVSESQLRDYENVSEKCGKFVVWRLSRLLNRGDYSVYRMYVNVLEKNIYGQFAHTVDEFYDIMNKAMCDGNYEHTIIVEDSAFEESKYTAFDNNYSDKHYGYVTEWSNYKAALTSSSYIDTKADELVSGYRIIKLEAEYLDRKYNGRIATTTQEVIDYVVAYYSDNKKWLEQHSSAGSIDIVIKNGDAVTEDIQAIEDGLKDKYYKACINKDITRKISTRPGYTVWSICVDRDGDIY